MKKKVDYFTIDNKKLCAVENFLDNPDIYRDFLLQCKDKYLHPIPGVDHWLGFRFSVTDNFLCRHPLMISLYHQLANIVLPEFKLLKSKIDWNLCFHYGPKISQDLTSEFFQVYSLHKDLRSICAGVIYMTPDAPLDSGTIFLDGEQSYSIDNVYNRMIFYDSSITHAPQNLFGDTIENGRLVITFFFWEKESLDIKRFYESTNVSDVYGLNL